ncbi:MAG: immunoglobulin domain-containing protein [Verrucomicrobiota bacterium]
MAAIKFVFDVPTVENGFAGIAAITVGGTPAGSIAAPVLAVSTSTQTGASPFTPSWVIETPNLIAALTPSTASGNFTLEGSGGTPALNDGLIGQSGTVATFATCGAGGGSGSTLIYTLTNVQNETEVTNIVVYSGWGDGGRDGQYYTVSYSTIAAPSTYTPIGTVYFNPTGTSGAVANRVTIAMNNGSSLASAVGNLRFQFSTPPSAGSFDNGYQGISEIVVQGYDSSAPVPPPSPYLIADTLPKYAETVIGDQVVFTADYSNAPPATLQWQVVKAGVTNNISGATSPTLTLNNVQVSDSGLYLLRADNATNGATAPSFSTPRQLVVNTNPAAVNGVIVKYAGQTFTKGDAFLPAWPVNTNQMRLIAGFTLGSGEGTFTAFGDFSGGNEANADPTILSDGVIDTITNVPSATYVGCGPLNNGRGYQITYSLFTNAAPFGVSITNIAVFGGWQDAGRNQQKYSVLYSTMQNPGTFVPLVLADYTPTDSDNSPVVGRTTLVAASGGALMHNVAALRISWDVSPIPKNGWEGYCEILAGGQASTGFVPALTNDVSPTTASDVVGSQLILSAGFSGYTSLQWQKNGTNIPGANAVTLTLNNLQLTDAGNYSLVASNAIGATSSGACAVTINSAPVATNNIIQAIATQTSAAEVFTPTWNAAVLASSLIAGATPSSSGDGDFTGGSFNIPTGANGPVVLTDGTYGTIDFINSGLHGWVTCMGDGSSVETGVGVRAGQYVVYPLPPSANGYNLTSIITAASWNDGGRDQQAYTVRYATAANPTYFLPLTTVNYNPLNPSGYSVDRVTITAANGVLASNVVALQFDATTPSGENAFSGYNEFAVYGSPSATPPPAGPVVTVQHAQDTIPWMVETPNLIAGQLPSSQGPGVFTGEGCNVTNLTDGALGFGFAYCTALGNDNGSSVSWITFTTASGWNLSNIVVYTAWHDFGREAQYYDVSYSTLNAPTTFLPLASVRDNPPTPHDGRDSGNRIQIAPAIGQSLLATNVAVVKFDFTSQTVDFLWSGYSEIVLQGTQVLPTVNAPIYSGGNLILTGSGGIPGTSYIWLQTTNLTPPIIWTTNVTGILNGTGSFSNAIPVGVEPARFFRLKTP